MPKKKYIVSLTPEERQELEQLTKKGKNPAYKVSRSQSHKIMQFSVDEIELLTNNWRSPSPQLEYGIFMWRSLFRSSHPSRVPQIIFLEVMNIERWVLGVIRYV